jgi:hypothetical protein
MTLPFNVQVAMVLLAHRHEDVRQIWAEIWAGYPRDVDLVGMEGGIVTSSSLFLSHIRFVGGCQKQGFGSGFDPDSIRSVDPDL